MFVCIVKCTKTYKEIWHSLNSCLSIDQNLQPLSDLLSCSWHKQAHSSVFWRQVFGAPGFVCLFGSHQDLKQQTSPSWIYGTPKNLSARESIVNSIGGITYNLSKAHLRPLFDEETTKLTEYSYRTKQPHKNIHRPPWTLWSWLKSKRLRKCTKLTAEDIAKLRIPYTGSWVSWKKQEDREHCPTASNHHGPEIREDNTCKVGDCDKIKPQKTQ